MDIRRDETFLCSVTIRQSQLSATKRKFSQCKCHWQFQISNMTALKLSKLIYTFLLQAIQRKQRHVRFRRLQLFSAQEQGVGSSRRHVERILIS